MRQQKLEAALRAIVDRLKNENLSFGAVDPEIARLSNAVLDARIIARKALEEAPSK